MAGLTLLFFERSKYQVEPTVITWPLCVSVPDTYFVTDTKRSTGPVEKDTPPPTCQ